MTKVTKPKKITPNNNPADDYDGKILGIHSYSGDKGEYYSVVHVGTIGTSSELAQYQTRACNYVGRYGEKNARKFAKEYDQRVDIFKNLANGQK